MNDKNIFKNQIKKSLWSEHRVDTDSRSIQEDSAIIQNHPATLKPQNKAKNQGIRNCSQ